MIGVFAVDQPRIASNLRFLIGMVKLEPALGVSVKSVRLVAERLGFYSRLGHTKDFKGELKSKTVFSEMALKITLSSILTAEIFNHF